MTAHRSSGHFRRMADSLAVVASSTADTLGRVASHVAAHLEATAQLEEKAKQTTGKEEAKTNVSTDG